MRIVSTTLIFFLPLLLRAQFYYGLQTDFGKNRVQYQEMNWTVLAFEELDVYYYKFGKPLAIFTAKKSDEIKRQLEKKFSFLLEKRIQFVVYNSFTDFKQSNIGFKPQDEYNIGGTTQIVNTKVLLYFDGNYQHLEQQIAAGIARIIFKEMMYGGNIVDAFANSTLINLPHWFEDGLVEYYSNPWSMQHDNLVKDNISTGKYKNFNHLEKEDAKLAGYSIWHYIANTYSEEAIAHILFLVKTKRNVESSLQTALGKSLKTLNQEWIDFYVQTDITGIYPAANILPISLKKEEKILQVAIDSKGRNAAFVTNEIGKTRIYLYDLKGKNQTKIISYGFKSDRITDDLTPIIAWEPDGKKLAFVTERKGAIQMNYYDVVKKQTTSFALQHLEKVLSMSFDKKGKILVLSAVRQNQSDIFTLEVIGNKLTNITNDNFTDMYPNFTPSNNGIVFSSNRNHDVLYQQNEQQQLDKHFDLYLYNYASQSPKLLRLTNTPGTNEILPKAIKENQFYYLSNQNGVNNRFNLYADSILVPTDTGNFYRQSITSKPITNYNRDIISYDIASTSKYLLEAILLNGAYALYFEKQDNKNLSNDILLADTYFLQIKKNKQQEKLVEDIINDSIWWENKVDILHYKFGSFSDIQNNINNKYKNQISNVGSNNLPKAKTYFVSFTTDYVVSKFDNAYIAKSYQPYTSYKIPLFLNPNLDAMIKVGTTDLLEDYKIIGGIRLSSDLKSNGYMISMMDYKKRLDKSFIFTKQSFNLLKEDAYQKIFTHEFRTVYTWPFSEILSVRNALSYRLDEAVFLATDLYNLHKESTFSNWITLSNEWVFDNTLSKGVNLHTGNRGKLFFEYYQKLEENGSNFFVLGLDARNYTPVGNLLVWANRLAASTSFGNQRLLYYMGGVDAWLFPQFNQDTKVDENGNFAYQTLATNMRGFYQNVRNGNSFLVLNTEIRIPVFRILFKKPLTSELMQNFQLTTFADFGSAWNGISPFSKNNILQYETIENGPLTIIIDKQKNPFVGGFGFGIRSKLLGYFVRLDWAWGVEDGYLLPNILYVSLGLDF